MNRRDGLLQLLDRLDAAQGELSAIRTALRTYIEPPELPGGQDDGGPLTPDLDEPLEDNSDLQTTPPAGLGV